MKKKLFIVFAFAIMFVMMFTVVSFADSVHNENTVDYDKTVKLGSQFTLEDGTLTDTVPIFDGEDALIWFLHDGKLKSIHADDIEAGEDGKYVEYRSASGGALILANVIVHLNNQTVDIKNIVVFNIMDDDIDTYYNPKTSKTVEGAEPFIHLCETFNKDNKSPNGSMALEYAFLRLDTYNIAGKAFAFCTKLKYVNLEDLTSLVKIGTMDGFDYGACFAGCTLLFDGQTLDLSRTALKSLSWGARAGQGNFQHVPVKEIKLPQTLKQLSMGDFSNCTKLTTVYFGEATTSIPNKVFNDCTSLEKIYFSGTSEKFYTFLGGVSTTENAPFFTVLGDGNANLISYKNYYELDDKSGKYVIYDAYCVAYNGGNHEKPAEVVSCTSGGVCEVCAISLPGIATEHTLVEKIVYANGFDKIGTYTVTCTNWDKCTVKNESWEIEPIFTAKGYSTNSEKNAINGGYTIKSNLLAHYESVMNEKITYGVVIANANSFSYKTFFDSENRVNSTKALQVEIDSQYSMFDCEIHFGTNTAVELDLVLCAYVINADGEVSFIQKDSGKDITIGGAPFKSITLNSVIALVPTALKED